MAYKKDYHFFVTNLDPCEGFKQLPKLRSALVTSHNS